MIAVSAAWAWLVLTIGIAAFVAGFDVWAHLTGHLTMTGQFRLWLGDAVTGPFLFGGWVAVFAGLSWHWLVKGKR